MNRKRVFDIARWEYQQKVRSKAFLLSLILTPILVVSFGVLPSMLLDDHPDETVMVGVIDRTGNIFTALQDEIAAKYMLEDGQPAYLLANYAPEGIDLDSASVRADRDVLNETIEGTFILTDSAGSVSVLYRSANPNNVQLISSFKDMIEEIVVRRRLADAGVDPALYESLNKGIDVSAVKVTAEGKEEDVGFLATFFTAFVGSILFLFLVLTTGQSLVRSLLEEKSNRIMELLVSSGTPQELMWGKLLGLTGLGLTQMFAWGLLGLVALAYTSAVIDPAVFAPLPYVVLYMVLGYLLYSALFVGVGSLITTEQEAQMVTQYLSILLVAPFAFSIVIMQNPDAAYIQGLSYFPLVTPSLMMFRVVIKTPPFWEIALTVGLLLVTTVLVIKGAGRIFRTAILLYGKRPNAAEVLRWLREG